MTPVINKLGGLLPLVDKRINGNIIFLQNLFAGSADVSSLLFLINICVLPHKTCLLLCFLFLNALITVRTTQLTE